MPSERKKAWRIVTCFCLFLSLSLAPVKELDVWYLQEPKTLQSGNKCFHIFWKVPFTYQNCFFFPFFSFSVLFSCAYSTDRSLHNLSVKYALYFRHTPLKVKPPSDGLLSVNCIFPNTLLLWNQKLVDSQFQFTKNE